MSTNATLTYYNELKQFKTIYIHHIEENLSSDIDSFEILKNYYINFEKVYTLFQKNELSHFDKDNIYFGENNIEGILSNNVDELIKNIQSWKLNTNYIYFNNIWFNNPFEFLKYIKENGNIKEGVLFNYFNLICAIKDFLETLKPIFYNYLSTEFIFLRDLNIYTMRYNSKNPENSFYINFFTNLLEDKQIEFNGSFVLTINDINNTLRNIDI